MIAAAYRISWTGWPGARADATSRSQIVPSPAPNQLASVAGNRMIDDAKIGGITPAMLSLSGRCELCPW
jgi:hypothetical protein